MTDNPPTIAALLTPLAPGGIAVIGLAGEDVDGILARILRRGGADGAPELADRVPRFCRLVDGSEVLDDVVVVRICRGGLATAEVNTHGGVRIVQRALLLLKKCGAAIVDAEVFASRSGTAGPTERDVDRALLGVSSRRLTRWLLAQRRVLPAFLDGPRSLDPDEAAAFEARSRIAIRLIQGIRVALIGPPNAGKSTLANRLIGRDRVVTSEAPGTTRDWVSETALICGWPVTLTDTAGVRPTDCAIEAEAIRRGRQQARLADLVVVVLDTTALPKHRHELDAASDAIPADRPRIVALNKCDLGIADCRLRIADCGLDSVELGSSSSEEPVRISAKTGTGIGALESRIAAMLGLDRLDDALPTAFLPEQLDR